MKTQKTALAGIAPFIKDQDKNHRRVPSRTQRPGVLTHIWGLLVGRALSWALRLPQMGQGCHVPFLSLLVMSPGFPDPRH